MQESRSPYRFRFSGDHMSSMTRAALGALFGAATLAAQQPQSVATNASSRSRPALTEADFARIKTLGASALSADVKWVAYDFRLGPSGPTALPYPSVARVASA